MWSTRVRSDIFPIRRTPLPRSPPAMATPAAAECPDPNQPDPVDDDVLRSLEKSLVVALALGVPADVRAGDADEAIRAYVDHLHDVGCPPEHVVIRVKRVLLRATRGMNDRAEATALCEALVLRAIESERDQESDACREGVFLLAHVAEALLSLEARP